MKKEDKSEVTVEVEGKSDSDSLDQKKTSKKPKWKRADDSSEKTDEKVESTKEPTESILDKSVEATEDFEPKPDLVSQEFKKELETTKVVAAVIEQSPLKDEDEVSTSPTVITVKPLSKAEEKAVQQAKEEKAAALKSTDPIWDSIKDRRISVFSLATQPVSYYFSLKSETKDSATLSFTNVALVRSLTSFLDAEFNVELVPNEKRRVLVTRK